MVEVEWGGVGAVFLESRFTGFLESRRSWGRGWGKWITNYHGLVHNGSEVGAHLQSGALN